MIGDFLSSTIHSNHMDFTLRATNEASLHPSLVGYSPVSWSSTPNVQLVPKAKVSAAIFLYMLRWVLLRSDEKREKKK